MKTKSPTQAVRFAAALRLLKQAETELVAAGEGLAAMKVGAIISKVTF